MTEREYLRLNSLQRGRHWLQPYLMKSILNIYKSDEDGTQQKGPGYDQFPAGSKLKTSAYDRNLAVVRVQSLSSERLITRVGKEVQRVPVTVKIAFKYMNKEVFTKDIYIIYQTQITVCITSCPPHSKTQRSAGGSPKAGSKGCISCKGAKLHEGDKKSLRLTHVGREKGKG